MTENQERAKVELQRYAQLQSELRILELKHANALDECQPGASWPDVGVVPGENWSEPTVYKMDDGTTLKITKKHVPLVRGTNRMQGGKIISTVELRRQIETQLRVIHGQMQELEEHVRARCDHEQAEVLIRSFFMRQSWATIAEALEVSVRTVANRYSQGLEAFGSQFA